MLFFSELTGRPVYSESEHVLGVLEDIIFLNEDTPRVTKITVSHNKLRHEIPVSSIRRVNGHVAIVKAAAVRASAGNELSVKKVLLDQQIIDLVGNKVVRVNDVVLMDAPNLSISGIDIGPLGILRRIGLEQTAQKAAKLLGFTIGQQLLSWGDVSNLDLEYGQIKIKQREEKLAKIHEEDLADYLELTNIQNVHKFIGTLTPKKAAEVLQSLNVTYQVEVFAKFENNKGAELINLIDPDEAVDILLAINRIHRDKIMQLLPQDKRKELHQLMSLSRTPVGKLMTSEFCAVGSNETAKDVLVKIKTQTGNYSFLSAVYALNRDDQLVGVFNLHELLLQSPDTQVYKFMIPEPTRALLTTPIEVIMYKLLKYNISALPVVNRDKKLLGIITIDDVSELLLKKIP